METTVTILNEDGLHARPAGVFAKKASQFKSTIELRSNGVVKNGKSIMSVMSMGIEKGSVVTIVAQGEDEAEALAALTDLVAHQFAHA